MCVISSNCLDFFSKCCYFQPFNHSNATKKHQTAYQPNFVTKIANKNNLSAIFKRIQLISVNDQDLTRAATPAQFNDLTAKMDLIRWQGFNLSNTFGFSNAIDLNRKIYQFEKVHFSNCLGLSRGLPRWEPQKSTNLRYRNSKLVC